MLLTHYAPDVETFLVSELAQAGTAAAAAGLPASALPVDLSQTVVVDYAGMLSWLGPAVQQQEQAGSAEAEEEHQLQQEAAARQPRRGGLCIAGPGARHGRPPSISWSWPVTYSLVIRYTAACAMSCGSPTLPTRAWAA